MRAIASASAGAPTALPLLPPLVWPPEVLEHLFYNLGRSAAPVNMAKKPQKRAGTADAASSGHGARDDRGGRRSRAGRGAARTCSTAADKRRSRAAGRPLRRRAHRDARRGNARHARVLRLARDALRAPHRGPRVLVRRGGGR